MAARVALHLLGEIVNEPLVSESLITMRGRLMVRQSTAAHLMCHHELRVGLEDLIPILKWIKWIV